MKLWKTCLSVYYSIFYLELLHGCLAPSETREINIDQGEKIQKRSVQVLTFSDINSHTTDLFAKLKLLEVQDFFTLNKFLIMFDYVKGCISHNLRGVLVQLMVYTHI